MDARVCACDVKDRECLCSKWHWCVMFCVHHVSKKMLKLSEHGYCIGDGCLVCISSNGHGPFVDMVV